MLKLAQVDNGVFDLAYDANALIDAQTSLATLVYVVLFTDAEASERQESSRLNRRGWWFDPSAGSLVWWYRQQPLSAATRRATIDNITTALDSHPALTSVSVTDITQTGNVSSLFVSIAATYNNVQSIITVEL